jgi:hypothetical protein
MQRTAVVVGENMECQSGEADATADAHGVDQRRPGPWLTAGVAVPLAAACFGTFGAWISYVTLCETGCVPPPRHLTAQLVIAVVGLMRP